MVGKCVIGNLSASILRGVEVFRLDRESQFMDVDQETFVVHAGASGQQMDIRLEGVRAAAKCRLKNYLIRSFTHVAAVLRRFPIASRRDTIMT